MTREALEKEVKEKNISETVWSDAIITEHSHHRFRTVNIEPVIRFQKFVFRNLVRIYQDS